MKRKEVIARDEMASLRTLQAIADHEKTRGKMQKEYDALDRECIRLATELMPFERAGSPAGRPIRAQLATVRFERDRVRKLWNFRRERLIAAHRGILDQYIGHYAHELLEAARDLFDNHRRLFIYDRLHGENLDYNRVMVRSNISRISEVAQKIKGFKDQLMGMNLRPLAEINALMAEARKFVNSARETIGDDTSLEEAIVSEASAREARESLKTDQPERGFRRL